MHGNTLAAALRKSGADVLLAPVYTPVRTDEENVSIDRLAMGGINVYLDESLPLWRWMPPFVRRLLDRPSLVSWAARGGSSTSPEHLGRLTVAMFRGEAGPLKSEIQQLVDWLQAEIQPDIVHLSNVMLAGLAHPLRERLGVPVVATLTGEDTFLDKLPAPYLHPGPSGVAGPGRRSGRAGGPLPLLCRLHGRLLGGAARENRRHPTGVEPGRVRQGRGGAAGGVGRRAPCAAWSTSPTNRPGASETCHAAAQDHRFPQPNLRR